MAESPGYPGVIAARFDDDEVPTDLGMDNASKSLNVNMRVWNTSTLAWERMVTPIEDNYWKDIRFDFTTGDLDYKGCSVTHKAAEGAGDLWYIWKYTWAAGLPTRIEGPLVGNWTGRAALDWA